MSPIRAYPRVGDYKEPFVKVAVAFLTQVLHIDAASILDISFESTLPAYPPAREYSLQEYAVTVEGLGDRGPVYLKRKYFVQEYAVTVRLSPLSSHLGDTVYLGMKYDADEYSISEMAFSPGWKPVAKEQVE